jgi:hypothetical protein
MRRSGGAHLENSSMQTQKMVQATVDLGQSSNSEGA